MIELMPKSQQSWIGTAWNCFEGSINLFATYYFMKISTHWFNFVAVGLVFQAFNTWTIW